MILKVVGNNKVARLNTEGAAVVSYCITLQGPEPVRPTELVTHVEDKALADRFVYGATLDVGLSLESVVAPPEPKPEPEAAPADPDGAPEDGRTVETIGPDDVGPLP